jgi:hypothetical protein
VEAGKFYGLTPRISTGGTNVFLTRFPIGCFVSEEINRPEPKGNYEEKSIQDG